MLLHSPYIVPNEINQDDISLQQFHTLNKNCLLCFNILRLFVFHQLPLLFYTMSNIHKDIPGKEFHLLKNFNYLHNLLPTLDLRKNVTDNFKNFVVRLLVLSLSGSM